MYSGSAGVYGVIGVALVVGVVRPSSGKIIMHVIIIIIIIVIPTIVARMMFIGCHR
jgi:hypothetical protein